MPPNRFKVTQIINGLESIDVSSFLDTTKQEQTASTAFEPLTNPTEQAKELASIEQQQKKQQAQESQPINYWDWNNDDDEELKQDDVVVVEEEKVSEIVQQRINKEDIIQQILKEEQIRSVLSISHIEENLKKDAAAIESNQNSNVVKSTTNSDDYWDMPSENDTPVQTKKAPQHVQKPTSSVDPRQSYWDWPTLSKEEKKQQVIDAILQSEKARQLLSADHIEQNLNEVETYTSSKADPTSDSYWSWHKDTTNEDSYWEWKTQSPEEKKNEIIEYILKEERIRQMLSSEHIEEAMNEQLHLPKEPVALVTAGNSSTDSSYWNW